MLAYSSYTLDNLRGGDLQNELRMEGAAITNPTFEAFTPRAKVIAM